MGNVKKIPRLFIKPESCYSSHEGQSGSVTGTCS